ncbi:acyl-CoA dehydrogenase family protein [Dokdonella sp.]|uniref:acyl-CoA dehydrogenase family protein n=1 Tax=Dokdonella sp. TaxID=2291710 RepID=UPI00352861F4
MNHPSPPRLDNQYRSDRVLQTWLGQRVPETVRSSIHADLDALGAHAAEAWAEARSRSASKPVLTEWNAWGERIDRIELTPTWQHGAEMAARYGLVARGYDPTHGEFARCDQFARIYLYHVASEFFTCPLAMTDGAASAIRASRNAELMARALPRLTSTDPESLWLSGQWMTELAGGSDVGNSETEARRDADGRWQLYGRKWFSSAVIGEMALTLARPQGAGDGADALAMFYVETRDAQGHWNGIRVDRLKQKLGTHELPTAEIHLDGALAIPVSGLDHGVRRIAPMLNVTRTWNAVCALATMRRCLSLATAYAHQRRAFGHCLIEHPLHAATLADLQSDFEAAFQLVFEVAHLLGRSESGSADAGEQTLLRILTPLTKLWTGKLAVQIASETCEAFGGAGYIEDTGIPQLLRDAQVFPIWEGTTNVLALDALRATASIGLDPLFERAADLLEKTGIEGDSLGLGPAKQAIRNALADAQQWHAAYAKDRQALQAGARNLAFTLARSMAAALLYRNAAHALAHSADRRPAQALSRFVGRGLSELRSPDPGAAVDLLDTPNT